MQKDKGKRKSVGSRQKTSAAMPVVARALRTGGSNRSSPAPTPSTSVEKELDDIELESGKFFSFSAKRKRAQPLDWLEINLSL